MSLGQHAALMPGLGAFKRIVAVAALAGLLAGLLLTGLQFIHVFPAILEAETYEQVDEPAPLAAAQSHGAEAHSHHHDSHVHDEWAPEDGLERTIFSTLTNVSVAVGFALILGALVHLHGGGMSWRSGLLWGAAGYLVFFLAPAAGLPPELPGTESAPVQGRQQWWLLTVTATAAGLALLILSKRWMAKIAGIVLMMTPHLLGAPQPDVHHSTAPAELINGYIYATAIVNAVFWLALGALMGFFYKK